MSKYFENETGAGGRGLWTHSGMLHISPCEDREWGGSGREGAQLKASSVQQERREEALEAVGVQILQGAGHHLKVWRFYSK